MPQFRGNFGPRLFFVRIKCVRHEVLNIRQMKIRIIVLRLNFGVEFKKNNLQTRKIHEYLHFAPFLWNRSIDEHLTVHSVNWQLTNVRLCGIFVKHWFTTHWNILMLVQVLHTNWSKSVRRGIRWMNLKFFDYFWILNDRFIDFIRNFDQFMIIWNFFSRNTEIIRKY